jgi:hypothetical protein
MRNPKLRIAALLRFLLQFHQALVYILLVATGVQTVPGGLGRCRRDIRRGFAERYYWICAGR